MPNARKLCSARGIGCPLVTRLRRSHRSLVVWGSACAVRAATEVFAPFAAGDSSPPKPRWCSNFVISREKNFANLDATAAHWSPWSPCQAHRARNLRPPCACSLYMLLPIKGGSSAVSVHNKERGLLRVPLNSLAPVGGGGGSRPPPPPGSPLLSGTLGLIAVFLVPQQLVGMHSLMAGW